jgi:multiple sugar transport system permease protein
MAVIPSRRPLADVAVHNSAFRRWLRLHPGLFFATPAVVVGVAMLVLPLLFTLYLSVHEWYLGGSRPARFVGFTNYVTLFRRDPRLYDALRHTLYFSGLAITLELLLGLVIALLLSRNFRGKSWVRTAFLFPMVAPPIAIAVVWAMIYDPTSGILNQLLGLLGIGPQPWIADVSSVIPSLVLVDVWQWTPFVALILLAGLVSLPLEPFEAAFIDGASPILVFIHVTLPLLRPTLLVALMLRAIDALKTFEIIYALTEGGPGQASETVNLYSYHLIFVYNRMDYGATTNVGFGIIIALLALGLIWLRRAQDGHR